ncbi:MAG: response regulator [Acidobacteriota bacterium]|nr:response regulator [Acidobacteriota bacterium]
MKLPYRILVLDDDDNALEGILELLRDAGYVVVGATSFDAAKKLLAAETYDLLIADVRLRGYNGLHLVQQTRRDRPEMGTMIMTGYDDTMMELEAGRYGSAFIHKPIDAAAFLQAVGKSLADVRRQRRWERKRFLGGFRVTANGRPAAVLDVSYGGLRLEVPQGDTMPSRFGVDIAAIGLHLDVDSVWCQATPDGGSVMCGAALASDSSPAAETWRTIVDRLSP